ncbi:MAG: hypothetical protein ACK4LT_07515 [Aquificaceae bacterium]
MERKDIWIVEELRNPSTDYYIIPALKHLELYERAILLREPPRNIDCKGITLIFVRYLTGEWARFIKENRNKIKKVIYFMDDDLFDITSWKGLSIRYIKKLLFKAYRWKSFLINIKADFFVSTPYLAKKYHYLDPVILPPYPIFEPSTNKERDENISIFYFGSDSHQREKLWLYDIIYEVMRSDRQVIFEIIGNSDIYKRFKGLGRVIVIHPMKWEAYKNFLLNKKRHIGLVPFFNGKFGLAKSYIKFFEVVACGAVGIYSQNSPYERVVEGGKDGFLIPNEKDKWIEAIKLLIEDETKRDKLFTNSINKLYALKSSAEKVYEDIIKSRLEG